LTKQNQGHLLLGSLLGLLAKLLVADAPPLGVASLSLLVGIEVLRKTPVDRAHKIRAVSLEDVLGLLQEGLAGAPVKSKRSHSALHATLAGADEVDLSLTLGGEAQLDGLGVAIAAELLSMLESHIAGLVAELETIAHLDVSVTTTNDLPNERGGHL